VARVHSLPTGAHQRTFDSPCHYACGRDLNLDLDRSVTDVRWLPDSSGLVFGANDYGNVELYHLVLADNQITKQLSGTFQIESIDVHPTGLSLLMSIPLGLPIPSVRP